MSESLAVKYRPSEYADVCSQESIIKILERQSSTGQFSNCYLFAGASGCGKTTVARIFANKINGGAGDPIEIDGASNNGVDNVKTIIQNANQRAIGCKYKVYIIDECHSLTSQAWQAFLKCIEEPPKYTVFIFCTTNPNKIPDTILNRVQRFNFTRIKTDVIAQRLSYICKCEGYTNYEDSVDFISRISDGGMRTAISYLETVASYGTDLSLDNALSALGNYSYKNLFSLLYFMMIKDNKKVLNVTSEFYNDGRDFKLFVDLFLGFCLDVTKYVIFRDFSTTKLPNSTQKSLDFICNVEGALAKLNHYLDKLLELKTMIKNDTEVKSTVEIMILQMAKEV